MKLLLIVFIFLASLCILDGKFTDNYHCTTFSFSKCDSYNKTYLPNYLNETSVDMIKGSYESLLTLRKETCGKSFELFLCAFLFPVCSEGKKVGPCKSFCKTVLTECFSRDKEMLHYCDSLPENDLCIQDFYRNEQCPQSLQVPTNLEYKIRLSNETVVNNCGFPCNRNLFDGMVPGNFVRAWIGFWSGLCTLSTLFTVSTFLLDAKRFQYPERPIIYLSACYMVVSISYLIGISLNNKITCTEPFEEFPNSSRILIQGTKDEKCIIFFMLVYFFSMAGIVWWVVLTITWYLAAKCHWAHEAIARHAQYWHFAAWAFPAAQTIGILAWGKIDADPYSGVCYTGLTDALTLKIFIIFPMLFYLLIGNCFLITGFISLFRIRRTIKQLGNKTDDLEKFIRRIGIFSVFYIVPAFILVFCYAYESLTIDSRTIRWYRRDVCPLIKEASRPEVCQSPLDLYVFNESEAEWNNNMTDFVVMMLKYLMKFVVGVTIGVWIWSGKTLSVWRYFVTRKHDPKNPNGAHQGNNRTCALHLIPSGQDVNWVLPGGQQMKNLSIL